MSNPASVQHGDSKITPEQYTSQNEVAATTAGQLSDLQLGVSSSCSSDPSGSLRSRIHCFTEQAPDATVHFQIIDLGLQLYIWVAVGGAKLQNMYLAIQSKQGGVPAVATLLPDATSTAASSLAQRLAKRIGRPVVCSCNLPQNSDTVQVIAERRLVQELKRLGLTADTAAAPAAAGAPATITAAEGQTQKGEQQQQQTPA